jgi:hypothetical protein
MGKPGAWAVAFCTKDKAKARQPQKKVLGCGQRFLLWYFFSLEVEAWL